MILFHCTRGHFFRGHSQPYNYYNSYFSILYMRKSKNELMFNEFPNKFSPIEIKSFHWKS